MELFRIGLLVVGKMVGNDKIKINFMKNKDKKTTIICGVYHEMTEGEKNNFINMMSENGKYNVIFDDSNTIPKLVEMSMPFLSIE